MSTRWPRADARPHLRTHRHGHTDTPTRTHGHSSTCLCQAAGSSCTQLLAKQHLKRKAKSQDPQSQAETISPAHGQADVYALCLSLLHLKHFEGLSHGPDNTSSCPPHLGPCCHLSTQILLTTTPLPFLPPPSPTQDLTITVIKMKISSGKTVMSSSSYQTRPVALAGFNLKM